MTRMYNLHQRVRLERKSGLTRLSGNNVYEIVRLLPQDVTGTFSYRLRSSAGERVALEHDLILDTTP